jgi:hypothetical protein
LFTLSCTAWSIPCYAYVNVLWFLI